MGSCKGAVCERRGGEQVGGPHHAEAVGLGYIQLTSMGVKVVECLCKYSDLQFLNQPYRKQDSSDHNAAHGAGDAAAGCAGQGAAADSIPKTFGRSERVAFVVLKRIVHGVEGRQI